MPVPATPARSGRLSVTLSISMWHKSPAASSIIAASGSNALNGRVNQKKDAQC